MAAGFQVSGVRKDGFGDCNELVTTHIIEIPSHTATKLPGAATDLEGKFSAAGPGACPVFARFWSRIGAPRWKGLLSRGACELRCLHRTGTHCNKHYV